MRDPPGSGGAARGMPLDSSCWAGAVVDAPMASAGLPLPAPFASFLEENEVDPSIYSAEGSVPRYVRFGGAVRFFRACQLLAQLPVRLTDFPGGFFRIAFSCISLNDAQSTQWRRV